MNYTILLPLRLLSVYLLLGATFSSSPALAEQPTALDNDVHAAIARLLETTPTAEVLVPNAKGVLVFPNIVKAGFIVGIQYGDGALVRAKQSGGFYIVEYYTISSAFLGMQAGMQSFGYAMVLMTDEAVERVETGDGWELGVGPSIVIVHAGIAKTLSTETVKSDVFAFTFSQEGLMAGMGIQGTKITRVE